MMTKKSGFARIARGVAIVAAIALAYAGFRWMSPGDGGAASRKRHSGRLEGRAGSDGDSTETFSERIHTDSARRRARAAELAEAAREARNDRLESREESKLLEEVIAMLQEELSEPEKEYLRQLKEALASNDNKQIIAVARLAVKSTSKEVKEKAIDALGWVGPDALPELTEFLMDEDEDIVQAAIDKWEEAIRECEDEADIISNTMLGMMAIRDEAACDYLSMNLIKSGEATLAVEAIMQLVECDNTACHGPAKEAYEWITKTEWTNMEDAKAWINAHLDM